MRRTSPTARRGLAAVLGVAAGLLVGAPSALAIEAPTIGDHPPAGPINASQGAFSWGAVTADEGHNLLRYEGGPVTDAGASPDTTFDQSTSATVGLPEGTVFFKVRAVQIAIEGGAITTGPYATFPSTVVDRTPPTISPILTGSAGDAGWYRSAVSVHWTCADDVAVASCPPDEAVGADGVHPLPRQASDTAGNVTTSNASVSIDQTKPSLSVLLVGTPNAEGWYRSLTIDWSAADATSGVVLAPPDDSTPPRGANQTLNGTATDAAGNVSDLVVTPAFSYDDQAPTPPPAQAPTNGSVVAKPPVIQWGISSDGVSGIDHFEVHVRVGGTEFLRRSVAANVRSLDLAPLNLGLPQNQVVTWFVVAVDNAGNASAPGPSGNFRIDASVPPAPAISSGPDGVTTDTTPAFSWNADPSAISYNWSVVGPGEQGIVRSGSVPGTSVTVSPALPDGDYTFQVVRINAAGTPSEPASRVFTVDTTAPTAPAITRPPDPVSANNAPTAEWTGEPGATFVWQVNDANGAVVQGPHATAASAITMTTLATGIYTLWVTQIDRAGHASPPAAAGFAIIDPPTPPPPPPPDTKGPNAQPPQPGGGGGTSGPSGPKVLKPPVPAPKVTKVALPASNAARLLTPRLKSTALTRTPMLRWRKGVRGTTLYNVQVFKVVPQRAGKAPKLVKVISVFPRSTAYKTRGGRLVAGTCYVWRVWPYMTRRFAPKALGVSHFCVGSSKQLAAAAKRIKANQAKAAKARR